MALHKSLVSKKKSKRLLTFPLAVPAHFGDPLIFLLASSFTDMSGQQLNELPLNLVQKFPCRVFWNNLLFILIVYLSAKVEGGQDL